MSAVQRLKCLTPRVVIRDELRQAYELKDLHPQAGADQPEGPARFPRELERADHARDPGRVDEAAFAEVDDYRPVMVGEDRIPGIVEPAGAGKVKLPGDGEDARSRRPYHPDAELIRDARLPAGSIDDANTNRFAPGRATFLAILLRS
jgi:hypothetical protein